MNENTSSKCLDHFIKMEMVFFEEMQNQARVRSDGEVSLCEFLIFTKRFCLLNVASRKHFVEHGFAGQLLHIAGMDKKLYLLD